MRLCSRVKEFGSFEPIDADAIRPGQRARLYCEMDGLEYQARDEVFISRLAARIELRQGRDGPVVWEQATGIARDKSPRPRRDYYVSYLIVFPENLEPGSYRLRLIQTDLIGRGEAAREVPLTIVR